MTLPFFYIEHIVGTPDFLELNEETSKHALQVLRMQKSEQLQLTDGNGNLFTARIIDDNKKKCKVEILAAVNHKPSLHNKTIAISLIKNTNRLEWFLEKAGEIGVSEIAPLICDRTEKQRFRFERMQSILISAMLQSQQTWLTKLHEPVKFATFIKETTFQQKFIAHCEDVPGKISLSLMSPFTNAAILIGPEGDFTKHEIEMGMENKFVPVSLGITRLRTETAGLVAATLLCNS